MSLELLAPVGSRESLTAALASGANAVYLGVGFLDMRSGATHAFGLDDLPGVVSQAHGAGVRVYVTLNAVVYPEEEARLPEVMRQVREAGCDAVIACDVAVMEAARREGLSVHLSTQCNVSNVAALRHYAQWADVVVLARELNLEQVGAIARAVQAQHITGPGGKTIRLEMFAHGALCLAVSGKCYLSLHLMEHAANRGECLQPCRRRYRLYDADADTELDVEGRNLMSPRDLCALPLLPRMVAAGATVFKIEGRARAADYVATVCRVYDEALRCLREGGDYEANLEGWMRRLGSVFNRGFWQGYYLGERLGQWAPEGGNQAAVTKRFVGVVANYYARVGVCELRLQSEDVAVGDSLYIMGPTTGCLEVAVAELRDADGKQTDHAAKGSVCTFPAPPCREGDKVYIKQESLVFSR